MARCMLQESVWFDQVKVEDAEKVYQEVIAQRHAGLQVQGTRLETPQSKGALNTLEQAKDLIGQMLKQTPAVTSSRSKSSDDLEKRVSALESENRALRASLAAVEKRLMALEGRKGETPASKTEEKAPVAEDDDDFDLFESDDEEELEAVKQERVAQYQQKKATKKVVIAKSSLILDVKPWDDETDMAEMERNVRSVTKDGLIWGASKILPVAYGIMKLQISCVIEDDKIGTDFLEESITAFEDFVQSVDVVAFNKI